MRTMVDERPGHLAGLGRLLDARGWRVRLVTRHGLPLLQVTTGGSRLSEEKIACDLAACDAWWFRWRHGDYIAPATEAAVAADQIVARLAPARPVTGAPGTVSRD